MNFGQAIEALKSGKKIARQGWNGKDMFLWLKPETLIYESVIQDPKLREIAKLNGGAVKGLGTICMKTANNEILTGWLASQTDILSEDWIILN